ncbi:MAG: heme NO-binding domain-containing protein [Planctomycetes bacterium]|nr:heme NO-binding domain-containing protein [Planctomycetota bacterium]MCB9887819.1 heme NO-binding domain-containing protein [Planctomycetota bacterium]
MYGLVNRAIEGLVCEKFGKESWQNICRRAGLGDPSFLAMEAYDDAITYSLVGAASAELGLDPAAILEAFGTYWTSYTIEEGYGDLLSMMGNTLEDFLDNLDSMHTRVGGTMPELVPPSFDREPQPDGSSILHYRSEREGLAPMVLGLLKGLAQRFDVKIHIEQLEPAGKGHERFMVRRA